MFSHFNESALNIYFFTRMCIYVCVYYNYIWAWFLRVGWAYKWQSYNRLLGVLHRSGFKKKCWKFVCMWRCGIVSFSLYYHIFICTHISLEFGI